MKIRYLSCLYAVLGWITIASSTQADVNVVFSNMTGHPSAEIPGLAGAEFRSPMTPFSTLYSSPNGQHWIFKAFTDNPDPGLNDCIIVGSESTGVAVAKEGEQSQVSGSLYGIMDSAAGINDSGQYVFGNRLDGSSNEDDEVIFLSDGRSTLPAVRENDEAPDLADPEKPGDELFGNELNSAHILNDGTVAFRADLIQNIDSDFNSALYSGANVVAQQGTSPEGSDSAIYDSFMSIAGNTYVSDSDGDNWIVESDINPTPLGITEVVVVNNVVQIEDGDMISGTGPVVDSIFEVDMGGNGDWLARGDLANGTAWVLRNNDLVALTGDPITPGSAETFAATDSLVTFFVLNANSVGDYVVGGSTDNADPSLNQVIVLNGETILAREGDPVDLNGNDKADDNLFIAGFTPFDAFLTDDRQLYCFATLRDEKAEVVGEALLRVDSPGIPGDLNDDGIVDGADLGLLLGAFGSDDPNADLNQDGTVDGADLGILLGNFG